MYCIGCSKIKLGPQLRCATNDVSVNVSEENFGSFKEAIIKFGEAMIPLTERLAAALQTTEF